MILFVFPAGLSWVTINFLCLTFYLTQHFFLLRLCSDTSLCQYLWPQINSFRYGSWLHPCHYSLWYPIRSFLLWQHKFLCHGLAQLAHFVLSFRVPCWTLYAPQLVYFVLFIIPFQCCVNSSICVSYSRVQQFPLPHVVITTDARPKHWAFYFQGSGLLFSFLGTWSDSMPGVHIALQELQAVALILCRMDFCLPGKVVSLYLHYSTANPAVQ